jgi:hypothetical protein
MEEAKKLIAEQDGVPAAGPALLRFEGLTLDIAGKTLTSVHGHEIYLTRAEFDLLSVLIRGRGQAFSRDQLLDAVAGRRAEPFDRSIDVLPDAQFPLYKKSAPPDLIEQFHVVQFPSRKKPSSPDLMES